MATIEIDGVKYPVIENLGFDHGVGLYAKVVKFDGNAARERVAVRSPGSNVWRWHKTVIEPMSQFVGQEGGDGC